MYRLKVEGLPDLVVPDKIYRKLLRRFDVKNAKEGEINISCPICEEVSDCRKCRCLPHKESGSEQCYDIIDRIAPQLRCYYSCIVVKNRKGKLACQKVYDWLKIGMKE